MVIRDGELVVIAAGQIVVIAGGRRGVIVRGRREVITDGNIAVIAECRRVGSLSGKRVAISEIMIFVWLHFFCHTKATSWLVVIDGRTGMFWVTVNHR